jgi:hypothetical protein
MKLNIVTTILMIVLVGLVPLWAADEAPPAAGGGESDKEGGGSDEEVITSVGSQGEIIFDGHYR